MKKYFRKTYHHARSSTRLLKKLYWILLDGAYAAGILSVSRIPIVINNFNRLSIPLKLIGFLELNGFSKIIILDNQSTYPPLLEYYKRTRHEVIRAKENFGHLALWKSGLFHRLKWNYFVLTDADVVPVESCPKDFMLRFKRLLHDYPYLDKVGFGLRIDDLPQHFELRDKVITYESRYWEMELEEGVYVAPVDTTFALYRPWSSLKSGESYTLPACRLGFPYVAQHLPWYVDFRNLDEEETYYYQSSNKSSSIGVHLRGEQEVY